MPSAALRPSAMAVRPDRNHGRYRRQQRFSGCWLESVVVVFRGDNAPLRIQLDLCFASHSMLCGRKPNAMITALPERYVLTLPRSPRGDGLWLRFAHFCAHHFHAADFAVTVTSIPSGWMLNLNSTPSSRAFSLRGGNLACSLHHDDRHR